MRLLQFIFNTLMGLILITSIFILLVIAMYMLKIMLEELFGENGINKLLRKLNIKKAKK